MASLKILLSGCDGECVYTRVIALYVGLFDRLLVWMSKQPGGLHEAGYKTALAMCAIAVDHRIRRKLDVTQYMTAISLRMDNDALPPFAHDVTGLAVLWYVDPVFDDTLACLHGTTRPMVSNGYSRVAELIREYGGDRFVLYE